MFDPQRQLVGQHEANVILHNILTNPPEQPVIVYFDPDPDGLGAGKFWCDLFDLYGISYSTVINDERRHGFLYDVPSLAGRTIVSGDFHITREKLEEIVAHNITYLHTDHHESTEGFFAHYNENGVPTVVSVNVNGDWEPLREEYGYQSGAGVVLEVIDWYLKASGEEQVHREHGITFVNSERLALVGLTLITDVRDLVPDSRKYLDHLFRQNVKDTSTLFGYLYYTSTKHDKYWDRKEAVSNRYWVDWKLSPFLNSIFQVNQSSQAVNCILRRPEYMDKDWSSIKNSYIKEISREYTYVEELPSCNLVYVNLANMPEELRGPASSMAGRIAGKGVSDSNKPTFAIIHTGQEIHRCSFRYSSPKPFRETLERYGIPATGHSSAFGVHFTHIDSTVKETVNAAVEEALNTPGGEPTGVIMEVDNLQQWLAYSEPQSGMTGVNLVHANDYLKSNDQVKIKYTGDYEVVRHEPHYQWYDIGRHRVVGFDSTINPNTGIIKLSYDRSKLNLTLESDPSTN